MDFLKSILTNVLRVGEYAEIAFDLKIYEFPPLYREINFQPEFKEV